MYFINNIVSSTKNILDKTDYYHFKCCATQTNIISETIMDRKVDMTLLSLSIRERIYASKKSLLSCRHLMADWVCLPPGGGERLDSLVWEENCGTCVPAQEETLNDIGEKVKDKLGISF